MRKLILLLFADDSILIENPNKSWNNYKLLGKRHLCPSLEPLEPHLGPGLELCAPTSVKHSESALCEALVWGNKTGTAKIFVWVRESESTLGTCHLGTEAAVGTCARQVAGVPGRLGEVKLSRPYLRGVGAPADRPVVPPP